MFRPSRDNETYEHIYTRRTYRKNLWWFTGLWIAILILRITAYAIYGEDFALSSFNLASLGISGILVGMFIQTVRVLKKSTMVGTSVYPESYVEIDPICKSQLDNEVNTNGKVDTS